METNNHHSAYYAALQHYEQQQDDTSKRYLFKVLMDYLKIAAKKVNAENFLKIIRQMDGFGMIEVGTMANQIIWRYVALFAKLKITEQRNLDTFTGLFKYLQKLAYQKPSLEHSLLLKFFLKHNHHYNMFEQFIEWWDIRNFRKEDYLPETFKEITYPALVESFYNSYSKLILSNITLSKTKLTQEHEKKTGDLIENMENLYHEYNNFKFFPYYIAKLKIATGKEVNTIPPIFLGFARRNANQFWVWSLLSSYFKNDEEAQQVILCRALVCYGDKEKKIGVYEKLFEITLKQKNFIPASALLDEILKIRKAKNWNISQVMLHYKDADWYVAPSASFSLSGYFKELSVDADRFIFQDMPEKLAIVSGLDQDAGIAFLVTEDLITFGAKLKKFNITGIKQGLMLKIIYREENGKQWLLSAKTVDNEKCAKLKIYVKGKVKLLRNSAFGMLDNIFVPGELLKNAQITIDRDVMVTAIRSFDHKKNKWGWKAIEIDQN